MNSLEIVFSVSVSLLLYGILYNRNNKANLDLSEMMKRIQNITAMSGLASIAINMITISFIVGLVFIILG